MFCPQCGREYKERTNYCCQCGTALVAPVSPKKKLVRSLHNKKIAGVCSGFAEYLDLDPTLVRVVWLMAVFLGGWGFLAYIIVWIAMPCEPSSQPAVAATPSVAPQPEPLPGR